ncbi:glycerophosphodiester phosphodiesterase [Reichenbachiella ulvae]|uniref:Glycerophosphodiester phosphodiesterase n=1 Tax=Reichenbachiella ulvae TaxID=2980104 RepID=A0ABT3CX83_9BACT|nr:glycerophosphodiester phosphodiesterase [Reichenbachiella ulvae]MCV9388311.1 glycerophosphodiester phosphodiesterase [Reichenbachiella ulvae]
MMKTLYLPLLSWTLLMTTVACTPQQEEKKFPRVDVQGHRGARGLMPENTIPAFIKALELGVTTLELDLAVNKDKELLVSHEPYMNHLIALDSSGNPIPKEEEVNHNIYQMTYDEIKRYDVGSKFVKRFPEQEKLKVHKPLLREVVDAVNQYREEHQLGEIRYNIEIKSLPLGDSIYHPAPAEFCQLVYDFVQSHMDPKNVNVQSFDFRILQYYHENYPEIELAMLIENSLSIDENLTDLGFIPEIYSCYHPLLDSQKVEYLKAKNMKVIPWTVNEEEDIKKVLNWGVDGIISDYPDRVLKLFEK